MLFRFLVTNAKLAPGRAEEKEKKMKLYRKYTVFKPNVGSGGMSSVDVEDVNSPFVLMPRKDPVAMTALECYATSCEAELGREIRQWIQRIKKAPKILGTQGERNKQYLSGLKK